MHLLYHCVVGDEMEEENKNYLLKRKSSIQSELNFFEEVKEKKQDVR